MKGKDHISVYARPKKDRAFDGRHYVEPYGKDGSKIEIFLEGKRLVYLPPAAPPPTRENGTLGGQVR